MSRKGGGMLGECSPDTFDSTNCQLIQRVFTTYLLFNRASRMFQGHFITMYNKTWLSWLYSKFQETKEKTFIITVIHYIKEDIC
jgi:hypothetical protein